MDKMKLAEALVSTSKALDKSRRYLETVDMLMRGTVEREKDIEGLRLAVVQVEQINKMVRGLAS